MKYCIFVERIFDDECFKALEEFCIKHKGKVKLFCLAPINYELCVAEQGYTGTQEELDKLMYKRYLKLEETGVEINLHVHLGLRLENINHKKIIGCAANWMRDYGFKPKLITFGWYIYNNDSIYIAKLNGLNFFNDHYVFSFHDYEYDKKFYPMMIITNIRGVFR